MKNKKLLIVSFGVTILSLSLVLVGCGPSQTATGNQPSGEPILVGAPIPLTGPFAADGQQMQRGLEMAVADINSKGGVLGRPLKLDVFDTQDCTPEDLTSAANKLILQDHVSANVTGYGTPGATMTAFGKSDVPFLHNEGSELDVQMVEQNHYKNIFMLGDIEKAYGSETFDILSSLPYNYPNKKIVILAGDFEWDQKVTTGIKEEALNKGWAVSDYEVFEYGNREWGPILAKISAIKPAIISFSDLDPADCKTFLDQFQKQPTQSLIDMGYAESIPQFAQIVGSSGEGVMGFTTNAILPDDKGQAFSAEYKTKYGTDPGLSILGTVYDGLQIWAAAVKTVGKVDNYTAIDDAIKANEYVGLCGVYNFNNPGQKASASDDGLPLHFFQIQNGKLARLFLGTKKMGDFIKPPWIK